LQSLKYSDTPLLQIISYTTFENNSNNNIKSEKTGINSKTISNRNNLEKFLNEEVYCLSYENHCIPN
jgi:hypothetical protein